MNGNFLVSRTVICKRAYVFHRKSDAFYVSISTHGTLIYVFSFMIIRQPLDSFAKHILCHCTLLRGLKQGHSVFSGTYNE